MVLRREMVNWVSTDFPQYDIIGSPVLLDGLLMSIDSDLATNISWTYL